MPSSFRHIALVVEDLQAAEEYYSRLLGMELIGREAPLGDGFWYTLPHDLGWEDARAAGIELLMVALRKDDAVLALFQGSAPPGQVFSIGLAMPWEEIEEVKSRLPAGAQVILDRSDQFHFLDQYGVPWQLVPPGTGFEMNGDASGRWLKV